MDIPRDDDDCELDVFLSSFTQKFEAEEFVTDFLTTDLDFKQVFRSSNTQIPRVTNTTNRDGRDLHNGLYSLDTVPLFEPHEAQFHRGISVSG